MQNCGFGVLSVRWNEPNKGPGDTRKISFKTCWHGKFVPASFVNNWVNKLPTARVDLFNDNVVAYKRHTFIILLVAGFVKLAIIEI